jgi:hypothetical protein
VNFSDDPTTCRQHEGEAFLAATKGVEGTWIVVTFKDCPNGGSAALICVSIYARLAAEWLAYLLSVVTADTAPRCELVHDTRIAGNRETRSTSGKRRHW